MTLSPQSKGLIIILSSPSGAGKSSLARALLQIDNNLRLSVSVTTRCPRPGEIEGVHYYFKQKPEFEELIKQNMFLEYAKIYQNYYGTLKQQVENLLKQGLDVLFDIDWQGARSIKQEISNQKNSNILTIYILPPSLEILEQRIKRRGQDTFEAIEMRMQAASSEIPHSSEYDYIVTNDDFTDTLNKIHSIIIKARAAYFS